MEDHDGFKELRVRTRLISSRDRLPKGQSVTYMITAFSFAAAFAMCLVALSQVLGPNAALQSKFRPVSNENLLAEEQDAGGLDLFGGGDGWNLLAPARRTFSQIDEDNSQFVTLDEVDAHLTRIKKLLGEDLVSKLLLLIIAEQRTMDCFQKGLSEFHKSTLTADEYEQIVQWMSQSCDAAALASIEEDDIVEESDSIAIGEYP